MLKRTWALIALVYLAFAEVLSWTPVPDLSLCLIQPERGEQAANNTGNKYCPAFHTGVIASLDALDGFLDRHDKSVVGGFTIVLAISTIGLWLATIGLYQAGERQLAHFRAESEVADFHRTTQFEQMTEQIEALKLSAEAAENYVSETRELVWTSAMNAQRQLRAYVGIVGGHAKVISTDRGRIFLRGSLEFKNCGQTPAYKFAPWTVMDVLDDGIEPTEKMATGQDAIFPPGANSEIELMKGPLDEVDIDAIRKGNKKIWIWGEVSFNDAFGNQYIIEHVNRTGRIRPDMQSWPIVAVRTTERKIN